MATQDDTSVQRVTFFFDPACPWTWRTSRWLVGVAERRSIPVDYRAFDLSDGAPLDAVPEQYRAKMAASRLFLRAIERAHEDGNDDVIAAAYTAYGESVHDGQSEASADLVRQVLTENGAEQYLVCLDDASLDGAVAQARKDAQAFSGEDTGSPVLVLTTPNGDRGFFGPVLAPTPPADRADQLWDAVVAASAVPELFELKRRRTTRP